MEIKDLKLTEKRKSILTSFNLNTINDILNYYPYRYEYLKRTPLNEFDVSKNILIECVLINKPITSYFGKRNVTRFKVSFENEEFSCTIFNRNWINRTAVGTRFVIQGKYEGNNKITVSNYFLKHIEDIEGILPYYSLKEGITQNEVRKLIEIALTKAKDEIHDYVPEEYLLKHQLIDQKSAINSIHNPINVDNLKKALARIKYNEFLIFFSCLYTYNAINKEERNMMKDFDMKKIDSFIDSLPFKLTDGQLVSLNDILNDFKSNHLSNRLLQGDVGSGKTIVSIIALYANFISKRQGALMVPTEVLAYQHYNNFKKIFKDININIELLTSSVKEQSEIKEKIENGDVDIVIGTHSLFQKDVNFKDLGYIVVDEQQRFGVKQRIELRKKGKNADILLMSATPIPRTLANTLYGGLDISTIKTIPSSRKASYTKFINENSIISIMDELKDRLNEGRQVYIIASSIEESDNVNIKDLKRLYNSLKDGFKNYNIEYIHGKMSNDEKKDIMDRFSSGDINILVSTTVIEVGIDVANATCMVVYNAERFGLSQLHQLRGRIKRGSFEGYFYLLSDADDAEAKKRLEALCNTSDGFEISLMDLKQRGPGDIIGTKQSGLPSFHLANIVEDTKILEGAKNDAQEICNSKNNKYDDFKKYIEEVYKNSIIE